MTLVMVGGLVTLCKVKDLMISTKVGGLVVLFEVRGLVISVKVKDFMISAPEALGAAALKVAGLEQLTLAVGGCVQHHEVQVHLPGQRRQQEWQREQ